MLPHFIVVGAMKSGTATLAHYLHQHPSIYIPDPVELHYFDGRGGYASRWEQGIEWYRNQFAGAPPGAIRGEKTPTYSYLPEVPRRIKETVPDVQLIWILRNPIDRAYSNYWHAVRAGIESRSFENAVQQELQEGTQINVWRRYVERSQYDEQVRRYLEHFGRKQMLFLLFENMKETPVSTLRETFDFLDVSTDPARDIQVQIRNSTRTLPRSILLHYVVTSIFGRNSFPVRAERKFNFHAKDYPPISNSVKERLEDYFFETVKQVQDLTGLDCSKWNNV